MKKIWILIIALLSAELPSSTRADDPKMSDTWQPLQFLIGDWVGGGSGKPGDATGEFSLKFDLDQHVLVRRNHAQLASAAHDDLMIIYPQGADGALRADYFDNEGHVIHYLISTSPKKAVFESVPMGNAPRFRLTYELKADNTLSIEFGMTAPGKPFQPYTTGTAKRK